LAFSWSQELLIHRLCHEIALEPIGEAEPAEYLVTEAADTAVLETLAAPIHRDRTGDPLCMLSALDHARNRSLSCREWKIANQGLSIFGFLDYERFSSNGPSYGSTLLRCRAPDGTQFFLGSI
jgi:hypothetical protein